MAALRKKIAAHDSLPLYFFGDKFIQALQKHIEDGRLAYTVQQDDKKCYCKTIEERTRRRIIKKQSLWGVLSSTVLLKNIGVIE